MPREFISIVPATCLSLILVLQLGLLSAGNQCSVDFPPDFSIYPNVTEILLRQEAIVKLIAGYALQNYQNIQALASSCDDQTNCSRLVCNPLRRDLTELTCEAVLDNVDCVGLGDTTCTSALFSRNRSYVRYAPQLANTANRPCDVVAMTCAQRMLDTQVLIRNSSRTTLTLLGWSYFGSHNGMQRIYPGKEVNSTVCNTFDIRKRPWYVAVTAIRKKVVVLLDTGPSMAVVQDINLEDPFTSASANITVEFLDTLNGDDEISVFTFGGIDTAVNAIPGGPVTVNGSVRSSVEDSNLDSLRANIRKNSAIKNPGTGYNNANLSAGLQTALDQFNQSSTTLNAIIIITRGVFTGTDLPPSLVESLAELNARVFMYRFQGTGSMNGNDSYSTQLLNISCFINGTYEENLYQPQNPLGTIHSFYSYVAAFRFSLPGQNLTALWVPRYPSFSGIGDLVTAVYPVLNNDVLLGVAGVDLLIDNSQLSRANVDNAVDNRTIVNSLLVTVTPPLVTSSCSQPLVQTPSECPSATNNIQLTGICNDTDDSKPPMELLKERVCCKGCCNVTHNGSLSASKVAGISVGSVLAALLLGVCGCATYLTCFNSKKEKVFTLNRVVIDPDQLFAKGEIRENQQISKFSTSKETSQSNFFEQRM